MAYAISFVKSASQRIGEVEGHTFDPMFGMVHVDEKWSNDDTKKRVYYLLPDEEPPVRHLHTARFREKTMLLVAVARPNLFNVMRTFDDKLGLWPFLEEYVMQRASKNRTKGVILERKIEPVKREFYKPLLLTYVFPSIKEKWPVGEMMRPAFIQQDNATPHVLVSDPDIVHAGTEGNWNFRLVCQPARTPDFIILDLGYFAAIQSLQYEQNVFTSEMFIKAVAQSFKDFDSNKLDIIFLTLQQVMECVLICKGRNDYKLPHMTKGKHRRACKLPKFWICASKTYDEAAKLILSF
uniref:Transposase putative n=1 Tax=Albugo laibachii Nc14 TaxID=890382 RepID=F0WNS1_9STRA|nr:transposase putative [Albugo laibachii Nc14]|eukprot:CCA22963.1 transposase putative [Albugo laibachii Nc14]